jgi:hypothetical protein
MPAGIKYRALRGVIMAGNGYILQVMDRQVNMDPDTHSGRDDQFVTRKTLLQRASDPDDEAAWSEFVAYYEEFITTCQKTPVFQGRG